MITYLTALWRTSSIHMYIDSVGPRGRVEAWQEIILEVVITFVASHKPFMARMDLRCSPAMKKKQPV